MNLLLIATAILGIIVNQLDTALLVTILVSLNVVLGTRQELAAQASVQALETQHVPVARVRRDGAIDTTTASGELMFNIFSSLAQFERRLIQERTRADLSAARARGRKGGRKPISPDDPRVKTAKRMHKDHAMRIDQICKTLKISRLTFYRYLALPDSGSP